MDSSYGALDGDQKTAAVWEDETSTSGGADGADFYTMTEDSDATSDDAHVWQESEVVVEEGGFMPVPQALESGGHDHDVTFSSVTLTDNLSINNTIALDGGSFSGGSTTTGSCTVDAGNLAVDVTSKENDIDFGYWMDSTYGALDVDDRTQLKWEYETNAEDAYGQDWENLTEDSDATSDDAHVWCDSAATVSGDGYMPVPQAVTGGAHTHNVPLSGISADHNLSVSDNLALDGGSFEGGSTDAGSCTYSPGSIDAGSCTYSAGSISTGDADVGNLAVDFDAATTGNYDLDEDESNTLLLSSEPYDSTTGGESEFTDRYTAISTGQGWEGSYSNFTKITSIATENDVEADLNYRDHGHYVYETSPQHNHSLGGTVALEGDVGYTAPTYTAGSISYTAPTYSAGSITYTAPTHTAATHTAQELSGSVTLSGNVDFDNTSSATAATNGGHNHALYSLNHKHNNIAVVSGSPSVSYTAPVHSSATHTAQTLSGDVSLSGSVGFDASSSGDTSAEGSHTHALTGLNHIHNNIAVISGSPSVSYTAPVHSAATHTAQTLSGDVALAGSVGFDASSSGDTSSGGSHTHALTGLNHIHNNIVSGAPSISGSVGAAYTDPTIGGTLGISGTVDLTGDISIDGGVSIEAVTGHAHTLTGLNHKHNISASGELDPDAIIVYSSSQDGLDHVHTLDNVSVSVADTSLRHLHKVDGGSTGNQEALTYLNATGASDVPDSDEDGTMTTDDSGGSSGGYTGIAGEAMIEKLDVKQPYLVVNWIMKT